MICGFGLRVKRALRSNVLHLNTLDYSRWNEITKQEDWNDTYNEGFKKLKKLQPKGSNDYSQFQFDLVMANPPFAGDIKENTIISRYELIQQRPLNYFQYHFDVNLTPQRDLSASEKEWFRKLHESRRQNSVLWFLDFVYRLRNALFHEIIDPLDEEWQVIFKNAYLVLKEIVDLNIAAIETR